MNIENFISDAVRRSVETLYGPLDGEQLQIQKTRREFDKEILNSNMVEYRVLP